MLGSLRIWSPFQRSHIVVAPCVHHVAPRRILRVQQQRVSQLRVARPWSALPADKACPESPCPADRDWLRSCRPAVLRRCRRASLRAPGSCAAPARSRSACRRPGSWHSGLLITPNCEGAVIARRPQIRRRAQTAFGTPRESSRTTRAYFSASAVRPVACAICRISVAS